jgi:uroporphyrinogen decarboxylase
MENPKEILMKEFGCSEASAWQKYLHGGNVMTSREVVRNTIEFNKPPRFAIDFQPRFGTDFIMRGMNPSPDFRLAKGRDEWGSVWESLGNTQLGEVKEFPLKDLKDLPSFPIPDVNDPKRWEGLKNVRKEAGDKFLLFGGISIYERIHFVHGLEGTWMDIYDEPELLQQFIEILTNMNISAVGRYGQLGGDGYIISDDWGMQHQLIISPLMWRRFWKPAYEKIFRACHENGMKTFLHSCGYIVDILDDLIEIGLDVIHMDQQENMGLELLGQRFGGRLTFFSPVDIQKTMIQGSLNEIRAYCRKMVKNLWRPQGGFIPRWYTDPVGAQHSQDAIDAMCEEFYIIEKEIYGNYYNR